MKIKTSVSVALAIGYAATSVFAQGQFQNLDFELAIIPPETTFSLPLSQALPGWQGEADTLTSFGAMYNVLFLDSPQVGLYDSDSRFSRAPISGVYSAFLMADYGAWASSKAELFQTGFVPENSKSLRFATTAEPLAQAFGLRPQDWKLTLRLGGEELPYSRIGEGPGFVIWGADASAWAGQTTELRFSLDTRIDPSLPLPAGGDYGIAIGLDAVEFSTLEVPEPSAAGLALLGSAVYLGWKRRQKLRSWDRSHEE